jgi:hypothetical protein
MDIDDCTHGSQLYTGSPPFVLVTPDVAAMLRIIAGERPEQPSTMSGALWQLVTAAWAPDFRVRPSIHDVAIALPGVTNN